MRTPGPAATSLQHTEVTGSSKERVQRVSPPRSSWSGNDCNTRGAGTTEGGRGTPGAEVRNSLDNEVPSKLDKELPACRRPRRGQDATWKARGVSFSVGNPTADSKVSPGHLRSTSFGRPLWEVNLHRGQSPPPARPPKRQALAGSPLRAQLTNEEF